MASCFTTVQVVTSVLLVLAGVPGRSLGPTVLAQTRTAVVALVGGRVYPSPTATPIDATIVMEGGRVVAMAPRAQVRQPCPPLHAAPSRADYRLESVVCELNVKAARRARSTSGATPLPSSLVHIHVWHAAA